MDVHDATSRVVYRSSAHIIAQTASSHAVHPLIDIMDERAVGREARLSAPRWNINALCEP